MRDTVFRIVSSDLFLRKARKFVGILYRNLNKSQREAINGFLWLAPSLIGVGIFYIVPYFQVLYYSVIQSPLNPNFVFLDNFISLFQNRAFMDGASNTLRFSVMAVPSAVILSLLLALILEAKIPLKSYFRTFFLSPLMVPVASVILIWQVLFHPRGAINELLMVFGFSGVDWMQSDQSLLIVVILFIWKNLGFFMILFMAALSNIPKDVLETAETEGAGPVRQLIYIKLRYLSPTLLFVTILSLINSFKIFREVYLLTGRYPYGNLYMIQHWLNNIFMTLDYQRLAAAAVVMTLAMIAIIAVLFFAENRFGRDVEE